MLQKLLGSQARAEILKKLFNKENQCFYLREFSRLTNISAPLLSRELRNLAPMRDYLSSHFLKKLKEF